VIVGQAWKWSGVKPTMSPDYLVGNPAA
jgi:hypothetical protein